MSKASKLFMAGALLFLSLVAAAFYVRPKQSAFSTMPQPDNVGSDAGSNKHIAPVDFSLTSIPTATLYQSATIVPYPTVTPLVSTLTELVEASNGIAEVEVTYVYTEEAIVRVESWLKVVTVQPFEDAPKTVNQPYLEINFPLHSAQPLQVGGHYILFLSWTSSGDLCRASGSYWTIEGTKGVYKIEDDKITKAGLPSYDGMAAPQFRELVEQQASLVGQAQPTVMPDAHMDDLIQMAHTSDLIVEASLEFDSAGTGFAFFNGTVERVLHKPSDPIVPQELPGARISLAYYRCSNEPINIGVTRYILFIDMLPKRTGVGSVMVGIGYLAIGKDNIITRGGFTHPKSSSIDLATDDSLNYYAGRPLSQVEATISDALQAPYIPQPTPSR